MPLMLQSKAHGKVHINFITAMFPYFLCYFQVKDKNYLSFALIIMVRMFMSHKQIIVQAYTICLNVQHKKHQNINKKQQKTFNYLHIRQTQQTRLTNGY